MLKGGTKNITGEIKTPEILIKTINMKTQNSNPVVLTESDYTKLKRMARAGNDSDAEMTLGHEIGRAIVVKDNAFPPNTIRINSWVKVLDLESGHETVYCLVMPSEADIRKRKISILSPMATALIGFREGDVVEWRMPVGMKRFKIIDVRNDSE